mgnify:CR=1 FL=1|jgi:hypothetical protein
MALSVSAVRSRLATAVGDITGFNESKTPYTAFARDPNSVAHKGFAVGMVRTVPIGDRQRVTDGMTVRSTAAVRFLYRLRPKDQITDYGTALDAEHDIIKACLAQNSTILAALQVILVDVPVREVDDSGEWFFGEVHFDCNHLLALT